MYGTASLRDGRKARSITRGKGGGVEEDFLRVSPLHAEETPFR
jgi:hypothetical protein